MTNRKVDNSSHDYKTGYKNGKDFWRRQLGEQSLKIKQESLKLAMSQQADIKAMSKGFKIVVVTLLILLALSIGANVAQFIY